MPSFQRKLWAAITFKNRFQYFQVIVNNTTFFTFKQVTYFENIENNMITTNSVTLTSPTDLFFRLRSFSSLS